ncbi:MAG: TonB family protein [Bacteroidetes bacterium]|nr:TonB family protein [Fibrella sp.]
MKSYLLFVLLLLCNAAFAQQPVYQPFQVDSVARPQGGSKALDDFLQGNMRKPVTALAEGFSGRVTLTGVVEADGSIADVSIARSLRPDCDREALRIFRLFNAWRPATRDGKAVRQQVTYSLLIYKPKPSPFTSRDEPFIYRNGARINYCDANWNHLTDTLSAKIHYKVVSPMSDDWLPTGDIVHYKRKGDGKNRSWREMTRYRLIREELARKTAAGKRIYRLGFLSPANQWFDNQYEIDEDSIMLSLKSFCKHGLEESSMYAANGVRTEFSREVPMQIDRHWVPNENHLVLFVNGHLVERGLVSGESIKRWYTNGQVRDSRYASADTPERVFDLWDRNGVKLIDKGYGRVVHTDTVLSYADSTRQTYFIETGSYEKALKQGVWTGRYADGSYFYEEEYDKGICQRGKAQRAGKDTVYYITIDQRPEFRGGKAGLQRLIKQNIHHLTEANRANVQGNALIRFTVCPDGTTCDYEVLRSSNPHIDREALRLAQATSGQWKPGILRGEVAKTKVNLPISFSSK